MAILSTGLIISRYFFKFLQRQSNILHRLRSELRSHPDTRCKGQSRNICSMNRWKWICDVLALGQSWKSICAKSFMRGNGYWLGYRFSHSMHGNHSMALAHCLLTPIIVLGQTINDDFASLIWPRFVITNSKGIILSEINYRSNHSLLGKIL